MRATQVNKYLLPVLVVVTLLGSVWVAKAAGIWQTSGRGQILLDESGRPDPAGIKGWMTLATISETYGVPLDVLYVMIGAGPEVSPETEIKELERLVPGTEVWALRANVATYLDGSWTPDGIPLDSGEPDDAEPPSPEPDLTAQLVQTPEAAPTPHPQPAVEEEPSQEPEATVEAVATHEPQGKQGEGEEHSPQGPGDGSGSGFSLPADGSRLPGSQIKGRMTIQEVVDHCQVPLEYLVTELGLPPDVDSQLSMRDVAGQLGVEVWAVRKAVERYQAGH
jgi:hypothetical protein